MSTAPLIGLTAEELRDLLEQAAELGAERALARVGHRDVAPANEPPRAPRSRRRKRTASAEAHEEIARMNARKGIGR